MGDNNGMVNKKLREHPKTENIDFVNDWWHTQKPLRREMWKVAQTNNVWEEIDTILDHERRPRDGRNLSNIF